MLYKSIFFGQTAKLQSGARHWNLTQTFPLLMVKAGQRKNHVLVLLRSTGWTSNQPRQNCWRWFLVHVELNAHLAGDHAKKNKANLACTDACKCVSCVNKPEVEDANSTDKDLEETDGDSDESEAEQSFKHNSQCSSSLTVL